MATPNPFDQFDELPTATEASPASQGANPFDQFDAQPSANEATAQASMPVAPREDPSLWSALKQNAEFLLTGRTSGDDAERMFIDPVVRGYRSARQGLAPIAVGTGIQGIEGAAQDIAAQELARQSIPMPQYATDAENRAKAAAAKYAVAPGENKIDNFFDQMILQSETGPNPSGMNALATPILQLIKQLRPTKAGLAATGEYLKDPRAALNVALESLASSGSGLVLGGAGGLGGGAVTGGPGGAAIGAAGGMGVGSFISEYGNDIIGTFGENGVDLTKPEQIAAAFRDEALMTKARDHALKRGASVALFDAISAGIAGRVAKPIESVIKKTGINRGAKLAGEVAEVAAQGGAGAGGEVTAQQVTGDAADPNAAAQEVIGEIPSGILEILGGRALARHGKRAQARNQVEGEAQAAMDAAAAAQQSAQESTESKNASTAPPPSDTMPPPASTGSPPPVSTEPKASAPIREEGQGAAISPAPAAAPAPEPTAEPTQAAPTDAQPPSVAPEVAPPVQEVPPAQPAPPVSTPAPAPHADTGVQPGATQAGGMTAPISTKEQIEKLRTERKANYKQLDELQTQKEDAAARGDQPAVDRAQAQINSIEKRVEEIQRESNRIIAKANAHIPKSHGMLGEESPEARAGLQALADNPDAPTRTWKREANGSYTATSEPPAWTPLKNGFAARQWVEVQDGVRQPRQEVRAPNGAIATRGLDSNGRPMAELEHNNLDELFNGEVGRTFAGYFGGSPQAPIRPALPPPPRPALAAPEQTPAQEQIAKLEASAAAAEKKGDAPRAKQLREQANRLRKSSPAIEQNQPQKVAGKPESTESRLDQNLPGYTVDEHNAPDEADSGFTVEEGDANAQAEFDRLRQRQDQKPAGTGARIPARPDDSSGRGSRVVSPQGSRSEGTPTGNRSPRENRTTASEGKPLKVHRGAHVALAPEHFNEDALGFASGHPSSGLGVWFTNDESETSRFGPIQSSHDADIRKPRVYTPSDPIPPFDSLEKAAALRRSLKAQGYDGIVQDYRSVGGPVHYVSFDASQIKDAAAAIEPPSQAQMDNAPDAEQTPDEFDLSDEFNDDTGTLESRAPDAVTDATQDTETKADDGDTLDLRRVKKPPIETKKGPYSITREGEITSSHHKQIWTDAGLDPDEMELKPAPERFAKATEIVKEQFGFTHIRKDPTLNWIEAIDALKDGYVGMMNLATMNNIHPGMMSLNGFLNLELKGNAKGALAYYDPSTRTIAMVRRNDAFAHEWAHALDDWLMRNFAPDLLGGKGQLLTGKIRAGGEPKTLNDQVRNTLIDVLNAMYFDQAAAALHVQELENKIAVAKTDKQKARLQEQLDNFKKGHSKSISLSSDYYTRARKFDGGAFEPGGKEGYWQKPTEMFARAFEANAAHKLEALDADHPFVTQSDRMYKESRIGQFPSVYPNASDREAIFARMNMLMDAVRDLTLEGSGEAPAALNPVATQYWKDQAPHATPAQIADARGVVTRLVEPFKLARQQANAADGAAQERKKQDKRIRDARLNAADRAGLRRQVGNVGLAIADKADIVTAGLAHSVRGVILSLEQKHAGHTGLAQVRKWFATDPGSGRATGPTYNSAIQIDDRRLHSRFSKIVDQHNVRKFTDEKLRLLRDVLVNAVPAGSAPADVRAAAAPLREFMNDLYAYNVQNGVEIGYTKEGYLPRVIDSMRVENNLPVFRKQAQKLYAGKVYDNEIGSTDDLMVNTEKLDSLLKYARDIASGGNIPEAKAAAGKHIDVVKNIEKLRAKVDAGVATPEEKAELKDAVEFLRGKMRYPWSLEAANDWELRIRGMGSTPDHMFEAQGPAGDYTKSRILPGEADLIMGDFLITDPLSLISTYISRSARRVNYGKFFGNKKGDRPAGWKLHDVEDSLRKPYTAKDGSLQRMNQDDVEALLKSIQLLTGQFNTNMSSIGLRFKSKLNAFFVPVILGQSMMSQLAEPFTVGLKDRNVMHGLSVYYKQMQDLMATLPIKGIRQQAEWRREMSEYFGIVSDHLTDQIMQSRYNLLYATSSDAVKLARFYQVIGVHPHGMSMRRASAEIFMTRWGPKTARLAMKDTKWGRQARTELMEYGIDVTNMPLMMELASLDEVRGMNELQKLRYLPEIRTAINRYVDERIAAPSIIDKPRGASTPEWSFMHSILGFMYAFQRNVLIASGKQIKNAFKNDPIVGFATTGALTVGLGTLMAGQLAAWIMKQMLWSLDDWDDIEQKVEDDWLKIAIARTGLYGVADPVANAFTGVKYQHDLTSLMAGPILGKPLDAAQSVGELAFKEDSPVAAYKASEAIWNSAIAPYVISQALSIATANPYVDAAIGVGIPYMTSKRATGPIAETAAEAFTGKDYKSKAEKKAEAATPMGKIKAQTKAVNAKKREQSKSTKDRLEEIKRRNQ